MSRVGRQPISIPSGVQVTIKDNHISVKGSKGQLSWDVPAPITVRHETDSLLVERPDDERQNRALHGTSRALIANMVKGVSEGFERKLEINGVGYRASAQGGNLNLELGYSHPIEYKLPDGITAEVEKNVQITLRGIDKQILGEAAAKVRSFRPPEPYKGKGVKYVEEHIRRKVGKKNV
ncbi:MAG: 50S ribosomal protein L6 [Candidatus Omnitrophica bacterium]|nr:50S ribosomal protein L6 [Candidatus Omnitrophota bacterium]